MKKVLPPGEYRRGRNVKSAGIRLKFGSQAPSVHCPPLKKLALNIGLSATVDLQVLYYKLHWNHYIMQILVNYNEVILSGADAETVNGWADHGERV